MKGVSEIDIYPVGLFMDRRRRRHGFRYVGRHMRRREWRAVRNYFNGYLAEAPVGSRAGHGWTKRRAYNDLQRVLRREGFIEV